MTTNSIVESAVRLSAERSRTGSKPISYEKLLPYVVNTLRFLVECTQRNELPTYSEVSKAIGAGSPQNANRGFGAIMTILRTMEMESGRFDGGIPDITTIVRHVGETRGGIGVYKREELANASEAQKKDWLDRQQNLSLRFKRWDEVLALLEIAPMGNLLPSRERLEEFALSSGRGTGKGAEHQAMQDWIEANLWAVDARVDGGVTVRQEYLFWSLDRLDVLAKTHHEWVGIEVKPSNASEDELRKGLYQVVKYRALLSAELLAEGAMMPARCVLVTGGPFPNSLENLARRFQISVVDNLIDQMAGVGR